jgi:hypothetical protein
LAVALAAHPNGRLAIILDNLNTRKKNENLTGGLPARPTFP